MNLASYSFRVRDRRHRAHGLRCPTRALRCIRILVHGRRSGVRTVPLLPRVRRVYPKIKRLAHRAHDPGEVQRAQPSCRGARIRIRHAEGHGSIRTELRSAPVGLLEIQKEARDEDRREPVRVARELAPMSVLLRLSNSMTSFEAKLTGW